jgi:hypothetical protein
MATTFAEQVVCAAGLSVGQGQFAGLFENDQSLKTSRTRMRRTIALAQAFGGDAAAESRVLHVPSNKIIPVAFKVVAAEQVPSADKTATVDLKVGNSSNALASILDSTVVVDSSATVLLPIDGVIDADVLSAGVAAGWSIAITVAVAGSSGDHVRGLSAIFVYDELPT